jgi:hypothetical protein
MKAPSTRSSSSRQCFLQHEPLHLLAQFGARREETRAELCVGGRHLVQRVPAHAAHETHRRQIAVFLIAQPRRHRARLVQQIAR